MDAATIDLNVMLVNEVSQLAWEAQYCRQCGCVIVHTFEMRAGEPKCVGVVDGLNWLHSEGFAAVGSR